ncbi:hypothetical protein [Dactylosporangium sp. NBC_01737]|uniref:hypothetical protein n=1 Tax=Dactylosporangium sp. NBC_01737 TaxID=2975959 RepID=UPI003FA35A5A
MVSLRTTQDLLAARRDLLVQRLADRETLVRKGGVELPRVTMLETEYLQAITEAEIRWIDTVLAGRGDGSITWDQRQLQGAPRSAAILEGPASVTNIKRAIITDGAPGVGAHEQPARQFSFAGIVRIR